MEAGIVAETMEKYSLLAWDPGLLSYISCTAQVKLSKNGITYSDLSLHTTKPNQENAPQASMMETISQEFAGKNNKNKN